MDNEIHRAFGKVKTGDDLINRTLLKVAGELDRRKRSFILKPAVIPCCLIIMIISGFWGYGYYHTETAVISIDINPSIELRINRMGRVLDEIPFGLDGELVLSGLSLRHMTYSQALETLLSCESIQPYLKAGAVVAVTLETEGRYGQQLLEGLKSCVNQTLSGHHDIMVEYGCAGGQDKKTAHHLGMSVGKYHAIQEVLKEDESATLEEFKDQTMKDIKNHKDSCHHGHSHP